MGKAIFDWWWKVMAENNEILEIGKTTFSFLSLKAKILIIGVLIGIVIIVIFPVVAIMTISSNNENKLDKKKSESSTLSTIIVNEVVEGLKKYEGATFPMPFESWEQNKDVVTSKFSKSRTITINGITKTGVHTGIDLVVISISSPKICAVTSGKVVVAKAGNTGYGNYVVIEHTATDGTIFYTLYGHMKEGSIMVAEGTEIKAGQVLGLMGSTGNSTGAHLHFEVRLNKNSSSNAIDPYPYLFGN